MKLIIALLCFIILSNCTNHSVKLGKKCTKLAVDNTYEKSLIWVVNKENLEIHGNPNVLTGDIPTSSLSQAPTAHTTLVEVKKMSKKYKNLKSLLYDFSHL